MDTRIKKVPARQTSQREETFPVQEQDLFPVMELRDRPAERILAEQLAERPVQPLIVAPVFVP